MALDVGYRDGGAVVAAVSAPTWDTPLGAHRELARALAQPAAEYRSGSFYERELPPLLALLGDRSALEALGLAGLTGLAGPEEAEALVVDGHAWLAPGLPGLGARLFEALGGATPVVGVAKGAWRGSAHAVPVRRGRSARPLYVTACGVDPARAAERVAAMAGAYRLPDLLRRVDALSRGR